MIRCLKPIGRQIPGRKCLWRKGYDRNFNDTGQHTDHRTGCLALGKIMDGIYRVMDLIGIHNLGVCIILLTIVIYTLLMPLTIKQQKFSKMSRRNEP